MYPYKLPGQGFNTQYPGPRTTEVPCYIPSEVPRQTVVPPRQPVGQRQTQCHFTGYTRELQDLKVCRCASPASNGDAYSYASNDQQWNGMRFRDLQGQELDWQEDMHRRLDILGKDFATGPELHTTNSQVLHPDSVRALENQGQTLRRMRNGAGVKNVIPHDAIWYGPVNPKGCLVAPPPEQCYGMYFAGANGGWDPVTGRSIRGTPWRGTRRDSRRDYYRR